MGQIKNIKLHIVTDIKDTPVMDKREEWELQQFLKKVDDIDSIIKELNTSDENVKQNALNKADNYLKQTSEKSGGFNKTVINKVEDETSALESRAEITPE